MADTSMRCLIRSLSLIVLLTSFAVGLPAASTKTLTVPRHSFRNSQFITSPDGLKAFPFNMPVYNWGGYTYIPLSYIDNRESVGLAAYHEFAPSEQSGDAVTYWELPGARYITHLSINSTALTANLVGQSSNITYSYPSYIVPPQAILQSQKAKLTPPHRGNAQMVADTLDTPPHHNIPALTAGGYTYWPMSYHDNREAILVVVADSASNSVGHFNADGCRYIWDIVVTSGEDTGNGVVFTGQANHTCTASLEKFQYSYFKH